MSLLKNITQFCRAIQFEFIPSVERQIGPLSNVHIRLLSILEIVQIQRFVGYGGIRGRPPKDRKMIAKAFIAKVVLKLVHTRQLINCLKTDEQLRLICGWETADAVPNESKFSRVFAEFAEMRLPEIVQNLLVSAAYKDQVVMHVVKDSVPVIAREGVTLKPATDKPKAWKKQKRLVKDGKRLPAPETRIEKQVSGKMTFDEMIQDLPKDCDYGSKTNSKGHKKTWKGYKLHAAVDDNCIPLAAILTSASVHDSQVAIPLATQTNMLVNSCYDLMDSAYNVNDVINHSRSSGHIPLIAPWPKKPAAKEELKAEAKRKKILGWEFAEDKRYRQRGKCERFNALFKDYYSGDNVKVRGFKKVACHVMFGILTLTAALLLNLSG